MMADHWECRSCCDYIRRCCDCIWYCWNRFLHCLQLIFCGVELVLPQLSLQELGYFFDRAQDGGKLVSISTGYPFTFTDQRNYEILGKAVEQHIYELLVSECRLTEMLLNNNECSGTGHFFASAGIGETHGKLLVLIHGAGKVRAGQWSRRLIINHSLNAGSQLSYIRRAQSYGWAVVVMNTNQQRDDAGRAIQGSSSPEEHAITVWRRAIQRSPATDIALVAHSYGGVVTLALVNEFRTEFEQRVRAIAFTDSAHSPHQVSDRCGSYLRKVGKNWVRSDKPLNDPIPRASYAADCDCVSAGTTEHEETSWRSIDAVFTFVCHKFQGVNSL